MIKQKIQGRHTTKYIFFNGSEISFKREKSAEYKNDMTRPCHTDKRKYSLVLSCSVGCNVGCQFCHLTQNGKGTKKLSYEEVLQNIKDVISDQTALYPELKGKAIKLCWMGEGEPLLQSYLIAAVTKPLLDWVFDNQHASYLDGVDVATSYPKVSKRKWVKDFTQLFNDIKVYERNPHQDQRSALRMFYSLHDSTQEGRDKLIPVTKPIHVALHDLKEFCDKLNVDLITHYMFIDGITDSGNHLVHLVDLWQRHDMQSRQLRILRYNGGQNGWKESEDLETCLYWLRRKILNLKVQYSSGKEVLSSCGMFSDYKA